MSVTRNPLAPPPPAGANADRPPSRVPIMLSAFVAPGAGQFAQRRWLAGLAYGLGFLALFVAFIVSVFRILWVYYGLPFLEGAQPAPHVPVAQAVWLFLASVALYFGSLLDTWVAYRRACSRRTEARIEQILLHGLDRGEGMAYHEPNSANRPRPDAAGGDGNVGSR